MHDFIIENSLESVDMRYDQTVPYTYFCHARNVFSWIDHVLCFSHDLRNVCSCVIMDHHPDNESDHLPLLLRVCLRMCNAPDHSLDSCSRPGPSSIPPIRTNDCKQAFCTALEQRLSAISAPEVTSSLEEDDASQYHDAMSDLPQRQDRPVTP